MRLGNIEAWVQIEGSKAEEYGVEVVGSGDNATGWIASEIGKRFSVHWTNTKPDFVTGGYVDIDGAPRGGRMIRPAPVPASAEIAEMRLSPTTASHFMFSAIEMTDDDSYLTASHSLSELGTIKLKVWRIALGHSLPGAWENHAHQSVKVHERSKKGIAHSVGLGQEHHVQPTNMISAERIGSPIATFVFTYRPLGLLKANGITGGAASSKRGINQVEDAKGEVADVKRARTSGQAKHEAKAPVFKKDPAPPASPPQPHVKSENDKPSASPFKIVKEEKKPSLSDSEIEISDDDELEREMAALKQRMTRLHKKKVSVKTEKKSVKPKREPLSAKGVFQQGEVIDLT